MTVASSRALKRRLSLIVAVPVMLVSGACGQATREGFASADEGRGQPAQAPVPVASASLAPVSGPRIEVVRGSTDPLSYLVLVTKTKPLDPIDFVPPDLVDLAEVPGTEGTMMRADAAAAMTLMYQAAEAAGVPFAVNTSYRSSTFQANLFARYSAAQGEAAASRSVARPGYSEHQTGLAADIYDTSANKLAQSFGSSPAGLWIAEHAHEYGFIISYPKGKEALTGYIWEPWHVRYVGVEVAQDMRDKGVVTLQEYLGQ